MRLIAGGAEFAAKKSLGHTPYSIVKVLSLLAVRPAFFLSGSLRQSKSMSQNGAPLVRSNRPGEKVSRALTRYHLKPASTIVADDRNRATWPASFKPFKRPTNNDSRIRS